eukprot:scaffold4412_cov71-Phaeocystis_antarctica.AAC.6
MAPGSSIAGGGRGALRRRARRAAGGHCFAAAASLCVAAVGLDVGSNVSGRHGILQKSRPSTRVASGTSFPGHRGGGGGGEGTRSFNLTRGTCSSAVDGRDSCSGRGRSACGCLGPGGCLARSSAAAASRMARCSARLYLRISELYRFLIALSVRPTKRFEISDHLGPSSETHTTMSASSSTVHAPFFTSELISFFQRSRHCFPVRPSTSSAISDQRPSPNLATASVSCSSVSSVHWVLSILRNAGDDEAAAAAAAAARTAAAAAAVAAAAAAAVAAAVVAAAAAVAAGAARAVAAASISRTSAGTHGAKRSAGCSTTKDSTVTRLGSKSTSMSASHSTSTSMAPISAAPAFGIGGSDGPLTTSGAAPLGCLGFSLLLGCLSACIGVCPALTRITVCPSPLPGTVRLYGRPFRRSA